MLADIPHLHADRGGTIVASLEDMSAERRTGYAWYGVWPQALLARDLRKWRQRHALEGRQADNP